MIKHARQGDPADAIIDVAEQNRSDLIVVGNKGMTGAKRFFLGAVPNKISHHAPCSVLIVRTTPRARRARSSGPRWRRKRWKSRAIESAPGSAVGRDVLGARRASARGARRTP